MKNMGPIELQLRCTAAYNSLALLNGEFPSVFHIERDVDGETWHEPRIAEAARSFTQRLQWRLLVNRRSEVRADDRYVVDITTVQRTASVTSEASEQAVILHIAAATSEFAGLRSGLGMACGRHSVLGCSKPVLVQ